MSIFQRAPGESLAEDRRVQALGVVAVLALAVVPFTTTDSLTGLILTGLVYVMLGVSCESERRTYRLDWLREQPAAVKFVSFEPLVECIPDVDLTGIDWAIIGGESGPDYRPMDPAWARNLIRACRRQVEAGRELSFWLS